MILFAALTVLTTIINVMLSLGAAFGSVQVKHEKTGVSLCKWSQCFPPVTSRAELNTHLYSCVHQDTQPATQSCRERRSSTRGRRLQRHAPEMKLTVSESQQSCRVSVFLSEGILNWVHQDFLHSGHKNWWVQPANSPNTELTVVRQEEFSFHKLISWISLLSLTHLWVFSCHPAS